MKKLLVLFVILTLFLSGCGIYNISSFVLPDDSEFIALIEELDTPYKICEYIQDNFTYEEHVYTLLTPYQLYTRKNGDCDDCSNFAVFIANYHGYETYQIAIYFLGDKYKHFVAVYKEEKYSFSDNGDYFTGKYNYNSFLEIVNYECYLRDKTWIKYIVYDYDMNIVESNVQ